MISAFSRLVLMGVGVLFVLVLVLFGLRQVGFQRQFQAFDHPLVQDPAFWIVALGGDAQRFPPYTKEALLAAAELDKDMLIELPLHRSQDGVWFVFPTYQLESVTDGSGFPEVLTWDQLSQLDAGFQYPGPTDNFPFRGKGLRLVNLEQAAQLLPKTRFVLTFFDPKADFAEEVATQINSLDLGPRVVIRSPFSKFVRELKKIEPMWIYAIDRPSLDRAVMMGRLRIETLASLPTDVVISELTRNGTVILSQPIVSEIKRQKKRLLLIIDDSTPTIPKWILSYIDGVLTNRPSWAVEQFRSPAP
ncbi:MAG: hypothetical protein H6624_13220 [Bdellovibrionaceae bacterium]|nr:hypothetical protein [Bdellovibrionales bacterium]MCB9085303.1 hypothetical protein [Pseudobdellovibrionaceae bacterium]